MPRPITLLLAASLSAIPLVAQERAPHNDAITAAKLRADLMFLGGDGFRGRLTNTPENDLALEWVKSRFEAFGLKPGGLGGSYFMPYNLMTATMGDLNKVELTIDGGTASFGLGTDFYPHRFSGSGRVQAAVVFAGFGISAPALGYDDLAGDVKGKIVLALDHEPGEADAGSPFDGLVTSEYASPLKKSLAAQNKGAAGIVFVSDVQNHPGPEAFEAAARLYWPEKPPRIDRYALGLWMEQIRIPAVQISVALAEQLVRATGKSLGDLAKGAETRRGSTPLLLPGSTLTLTTSVVRHTIRDRNVLAMLEGSDPVRKDEWIVVSGHPDHDGADGPQIWNGADDNGSGTVGLVAIAEAYALAAKEGHGPKRSVLFAAFNSEERGLLGAWAFAEAPLVPLDKIVAVLNMDMIGRNEEVPEGGGARFRGLPPQTAESNHNSVTLLGWSRSTSLTAAVEAANQGYGLKLKKDYDNNVSNLIRRSDHWPFLQHGVPAIWFHTGLHPDYHTIYDRPEKINYPKMEKIARLVHQVSWDLAQSSGRPRLGGAIPWRMHGEQPTGKRMTEMTQIIPGTGSSAQMERSASCPGCTSLGDDRTTNTTDEGLMDGPEPIAPTSANRDPSGDTMHSRAQGEPSQIISSTGSSTQTQMKRSALSLLQFPVGRRSRDEHNQPIEPTSASPEIHLVTQWTLEPEWTRPGHPGCSSSVR